MTAQGAPPDRFSRERLAGYDPDQMSAGVVLIAGAGALAQTLIANLALPGVGEIRVIDFDEFEPHNAARSIYYPSAEEQAKLGMKKAVVVAHKAHQAMLADAPVMRYATTAVQALGLGAFDGVRVVVSAVDNPRARAYLSDSCQLLGIPLIEAGFDGPAISMSCFPSTGEPQKPCYRCGNPGLVGTFSCQRYAVAAEEAGVIPAIQPASSALAGLQAEATIQALHGNFPTAYKRTTFNVRTGAGMQYGLSYNDECQGVHRQIEGPVRKLNIGAHNTLAELVAAVEQAIGEDAELYLPDPLIVDATCTNCGHVVAVVAPEWSYAMNSHCIDCGGPWETLGEAPLGYSPNKPATISRTTEPLTLSRSCRQVGLPPTAIFEARMPGSYDLAAFQLAGSVDDLFYRVGD